MTFYFYDLETTGINPRESRIMQFGGQRTDEMFNPIGEPDNILITLTPDILPDPDAILITGITPQQTQMDGITEAEFLRYFTKEIATPNTVMMGFNSIRFDDEFIRNLHYRNFYDAYEWQWKDGRGKWDLLDVARMTRALRPDGITWPFASDGTPSNRLELLTSVNGLDHSDAHDALSDVNACIDLAKLLQSKQPKLFDYLLQMRDKKKVMELVIGGQPFVYTSGRYDATHEKTTVASYLSEAPGKQGVLVYDLRHDPAEWINKSAAELAGHMFLPFNSKIKPLPVKVLRTNCCPAVAPLGTLDSASQERLQLDLGNITGNLSTLRGSKDFADNVKAAFVQSGHRQQADLLVDQQTVDSQLYNGFFGEADKTRMRAVRVADGDDFNGLKLDFDDQRLNVILPLYKARNYPKQLSAQERGDWEAYRTHHLMDGEQKSRAASYFKRLEQLASKVGITENETYLLEELQLYGQSVLPVAETD